MCKISKDFITKAKEDMANEPIKNQGEICTSSCKISVAALQAVGGGDVVLSPNAMHWAISILAFQALGLMVDIHSTNALHWAISI